MSRVLTSYRLRRATRSVRVGMAVLAVASAARGNAQTAPALTNVPHPRVAVVLSGGTAKALADIGVFDVLEQMGIPIDAVTGTSAGALIGGLYAAGYSPPALERLVDAQQWNTFFNSAADRRLQRPYAQRDDERFTITFPFQRGRPTLPAGVMSRQPVAERLDRFLWPVDEVTDFMQLPTAFGALVTDLATGDAVLIQRGSLAQAIEGSFAVPGAFAPMVLADGREVVDGAVNRNIPAEDARRLGADIVICVDVTERSVPLDQLHSLIDVVNQTVSFRTAMSNAVERPLCSVIIEPDIKGLSEYDFKDVSNWAERGRTAAGIHHDELQAIADSVHRLRGIPAPRRTIPPAESVFVRKIVHSHLTAGGNSVAQSAIKLRDSSWVTLRQAEVTAGRLFATGRFDQVSYRTVAHDGGHDLLFDLAEGDRDQLGVGVRYDTPQGPALLADFQVADLISHASNASISVRLGQTRQFNIQDVLGEGSRARFVQTYSATSTTTTLRTLDVPTGTKAPGLYVQQVTGRVERGVGLGLVVGGELSHEWSRDGVEGGDGPFALHAESLNLAAWTLSRDTRNEVVAPTHGTEFSWRTEVGVPSGNGGHDFARHVIDAQGAHPIGGGVSLIGSARWGDVTGSNLPLHDWFFLGGSIQPAVWRSQDVPFLGLNPQSVAGRSVRVFQGAAQASGPAGLILELGGSVGNVFNSYPVPGAVAGYRRGMGFSVTRKFAPGPVTFSFGSRSLKQRPVMEIAFGATF